MLGTPTPQPRNHLYLRSVWNGRGYDTVMLCGRLQQPMNARAGIEGDATTPIEWVGCEDCKREYRRGMGQLEMFA